jgi:hypothetical protein
MGAEPTESESPDEVRDDGPIKPLFRGQEALETGDDFSYLDRARPFPVMAFCASSRVWDLLLLLKLLLLELELTIEASDQRSVPSDDHMGSIDPEVVDGLSGGRGGM